MKKNWYKITCFTFAATLTATMYIYGFPAMLDDITQWRNGGIHPSYVKDVDAISKAPAIERAVR